MLKLMRDSFQQLKWILVAIVAIFILFIFVDWGAGGARSNRDQERSYAARVNGETISFREYDRALYYTEKNYEQIYRQPITPELAAAMGLTRYVLYPASREAATISISPAEVDQYYKANQAKYAHGEQREVKYLLADLAVIRSQINPSDSELRKRYEASKEDYKRPAAAHILHLLIQVDPTASPE